ncbi:lactate racemase domain-containing protein [Enterocloster lavalensis]|nr:lactate racemase domain-containing protein [Enterocloster lavalensis]
MRPPYRHAPIGRNGKPQDKITIIVNDQTRPGPHAQMAREIVRRLSEAGVSDDPITFVIATGSHAGPRPDQLHVILGGLEEHCAWGGKPGHPENPSLAADPPL